MSRIGNAPISVPAGVDVTVDGSVVTMKGSQGTLTRTVSDKVTVSLDGAILSVARLSEDRDSKALHGLTRALLANMVTGVSVGFVRQLQTVGVGYRAILTGRSLELQVGYSHPVILEAPEGIEIEVPEPTKIVVKGIDKEKVGQMAANIRSVRPPEPYKGKGIRYVDEQVRRKAGKAGVKR
ncbi:MAG: 50S ribosomal protein L6 [Acidimicrobiia bacterium]|nr:50S ribosomal protein L6 [Acidimicrobiia bacterium]